MKESKKRQRISRPKLWIKADLSYCFVDRPLPFIEPIDGEEDEIYEESSVFLWMVRSRRPTQEIYVFENIESMSTCYKDTIKLLPWTKNLKNEDGWVEVDIFSAPLPLLEIAEVSE